MPDDNKQKVHEELFMSWLEGGPLDPELESDEVWKSRVDAAKFFREESHAYSDQKVPHWDRGAAFIDDTPKWWEWSKLPVVSMAFSVFAVFLVLFNVRLVVGPEGMLVSFGQNKETIDQSNLNMLVDLKLKEFAAEQQVVLANYAVDINQKQQNSNLQLATYILGASRQERKEDISEFLRYINDQREDEQLDQKIKFQQIEYKLDKQESLIKANSFVPRSYQSEKE